MVRVIEEAPVESTGVADVLMGVLWLTALLVVVAVLAGFAYGALLIGIKKLREKSGRDPIPDSETLRIT